MNNKRILKGLILISIITIAFLIGATTKQNKQSVKVEKIIYTSTEDFKIEEGETGVIFSDGSWASVNESKGYYIFQPIELGDWNYSFDNLEDLKKCVNVYIENANR